MSLKERDKQSYLSVIHDPDWVFDLKKKSYKGHWDQMEKFAYRLFIKSYHEY